MSIVRTIDLAVEDMLNNDPSLIEFDRYDLQQAIEDRTGQTWDVSEVSMGLQMHRNAQARGKCKYTICSRGKARASRWYIMDAPGREKVTSALTLGHAKHIANEAARQIKSDVISELQPSQVTNPAVRALLDSMEQFLQAQVIGMVSMVNTVLSASAQPVDDRNVKDYVAA
jgi:hypothetical protein